MYLCCEWSRVAFFAPVKSNRVKMRLRRRFAAIPSYRQRPTYWLVAPLPSTTNSDSKRHMMPVDLTVTTLAAIIHLHQVVGSARMLEEGMDVHSSDSTPPLPIRLVQSTVVSRHTRHPRRWGDGFCAAQTDGLGRIPTGISVRFSWL